MAPCEALCLQHNGGRAGSKARAWGEAALGGGRKLGRIYIGTSGWSYPGWREGIYAGVPRRLWLSRLAEHFNAVEINATFYGAQRRETFARWAEATPPQFRFAMKANRYITHNKKLLGCAGPVRRERERALGLGGKLSAVVWQLPAGLHRKLERLEAFAEVLGQWPEVRQVMEFRHPSWFDDEVADCLRRHRLAVCISDAADWPLWDEVTTDLVYLRLHGHTRTYVSAYSTPALRRWAGRIGAWRAEGRDVHVYFDNDAAGAAPRDALRLRGMLDL